MLLTELECRSAKPSARLRKLSDGGGLQLWVMPNGSRLWRLAYRLRGKQKLLAIGAYPIVGLADARKAREVAKRLLAQRIDPIEARREERNGCAGDSFKLVAEEYLEKLGREGRADATLSKVAWLLGLSYEMIGNVPIAELTPRQVLEVLRTVERRGRHETANRLRSTIGSVFRYAVATCRAESDPTQALKGTLTRPVVKPRAAIVEPKAFGALLRAIDAFEGQPATRAALRLMPLLFPRPGELRPAEWPEFDL